MRKGQMDTQTLKGAFNDYVTRLQIISDGVPVAAETKLLSQDQYCTKATRLHNSELRT